MRLNSPGPRDVPTRPRANHQTQNVKAQSIKKQMRRAIGSVLRSEIPCDTKFKSNQPIAASPTRTDHAGPPIAAPRLWRIGLLRCRTMAGPSV